MKHGLRAALLLSAALLVGTSASPAGAAVGVGEKPQYNLNLAGGGGQLSSEKLKGKIVLIDFWATWCGPCMAQAPHMVEVNSKYAAKGLQIVGISLDDAAPPMMKVAQE